ncbi:hypothetical protein Cop2CBH44_03000 [Coprobacter secundus subsp. similis]|jgi:hypothetical protein|uniref:Uncharacterized protein n=1 Tax=Coprobacter secundus subsp. similis TaxID=2751153 RepID=A0A7G1HWE1_9BACT|nr:hypothetical protein Cop2CBH44_03000 [Coprobacter secundus subsp. similis]
MFSEKVKNPLFLSDSKVETIGERKERFFFIYYNKCCIIGNLKIKENHFDTFVTERHILYIAGDGLLLYIFTRFYDFMPCRIRLSP